MTRILKGDVQVHSPLNNRQTGEFEGLEPEVIAGEVTGVDFLFYTSHQGYPNRRRLDRLRRLAPTTFVTPITEVIAHEADGDPGWHVAVISDDSECLPRIGPHCSFSDLCGLKESRPQTTFGLYHSGLPSAVAPQSKSEIVKLVRKYAGLISVFEVLNGALLFLDKFSITCSVAMLEACCELMESEVPIAIVGGSDARKPGEHLPVGAVYTKATVQHTESVFDALRNRTTSVSVLEMVNPKRVARLRDRCPSAFAEFISVE